MRIFVLRLAPLVALVACNPAPTEWSNTTLATQPAKPATPARAPTVTDWPPAPGTPGGLPDDRTPLSEGPINPKSPQGAAQVAERYAALLEQMKFADAYGLWAGGNPMTLGDFTALWEKYGPIHALVGVPTNGEGAAGSLFIDVPLQIYGTIKDGGGRFNLIGHLTLRRVNDVPGASPEQLRWHITAAELKPRM